MKMQKYTKDGIDAEHALAQNEGGQAGQPALWLALGCFMAAGIWSLMIGGWIRLGRRIWSAWRRWRCGLKPARRVRAGRYWFSNELNA